MKSRSRPPLILRKRRPALPGSPAAEDEAARRRAGREQRGPARRPPAESDRRAPSSAEAAPEDPACGGGGGSPNLGAGAPRSPSGSAEEARRIATDRGAPEEEEPAGTRPWALEEPAFWASQPLGSPEEEGSGNEEAASSGLDNSLTNIQWLGRMTSNGLGSCVVTRDTEKENQTPKQKTLKSEGGPTVATVSSTLWHESFSERPPYSYMAMIQFAINSTEKKRMMLKDIYTWIEDHFPYFKHVAKPGWKNSVRHNLSLHDMFVRETSANGKVAFWTIRPGANRYLTLDQVFKQQKRPTLDLWKNVKGSQAEPQTSRPRIKPLLPRVSSHLVPVQFPVSEPLCLQSPSRPPLPAAAGAPGAVQIHRGERPVPKILRSSEELVLFPAAGSIKEESYCGEGSSSPSPPQPLEEGDRTGSGEPSARVLRGGFRSQEWASAFLPVWPVKQEPAQGGGEQSLCVQAAPVKPKRQATGLRSAPQSTLAIKRQELGRSRRKQHLALSSPEEPVLLLPLGGGPPSFPVGHCPPPAQEHPLGNTPHLVCAPGGEGCFETPVKGVSCKPPIASTPNKTPVPTSTPLPAPDQWRLAPLVKERSEVDFSPLRPSPLPFLPFQDNLDLLGFPEAPLRPPLCDSPQRPLLNVEAGEIVPGLLTSSPTPSTVASELPGDTSLLEGLVLDTMPDNWSRISLDVSFPDTENDDLETDLNWSQFLPQLK